jgi:hypothetical protein
MGRNTYGLKVNAEGERDSQPCLASLPCLWQPGLHLISSPTLLSLVLTNMSRTLPRLQKNVLPCVSTESSPSSTKVVKVHLDAPITLGFDVTQHDELMHAQRAPPVYATNHLIWHRDIIADLPFWIHLGNLPNLVTPTITVVIIIFAGSARPGSRQG